MYVNFDKKKVYVKKSVLEVRDGVNNMVHVC